MEDDYKNITGKGAVARIAHATTPFDAVLWRKWFDFYLASKKGPAIKAMRRVISKGTVAFCEAHDMFKLGTVTYADPMPIPRTPGKAITTTFHVRNEDCLDTEAFLRQLGLNTCVLNMASVTNPGGGWIEGAGAQEESLFRRSNYFQCLKEDAYPIPEFGALLSRYVSVFRDTEANGYAFLPITRLVHFIAAAAYKHPPLGSSGALEPHFFDATKRKIRAILRVAAAGSFDSIVLSAFGCGAYKNPPLSMALAFYQVFEEAEFKDHFHTVAFAIFDDHNATGPEGNFAPFRDMFCSTEPSH